LEFEWKSPFRFLLTRTFGITSGGGPLISVGIFRPKCIVPFLTNRFFALIREFRGETNSGKSLSYWLARFNRKMSFHFAWEFPLISEWSVWHNGKHPNCLKFYIETQVSECYSNCNNGIKRCRFKYLSCIPLQCVQTIVLAGGWGVHVHTIAVFLSTLSVTHPFNYLFVGMRERSTFEI